MYDDAATAPFLAKDVDKFYKPEIYAAALEAMENVDSAVADRTAGTAVVTGTALDAAALKAAVEEAGYQVTG